MMTMGTLGRLAAGLGLSLLVSSGVARAQGAAPADPWTQVPPLPTTYYRDFDFEGRLVAAEQRNNAPKGNFERRSEKRMIARSKRNEPKKPESLSNILRSRT